MTSLDLQPAKRTILTIDGMLTWQSDNPLDTTTESGGAQTDSAQPADK
jgi:hypothetical protein